MKKIIAIGGSSSKKSINKKLAEFTAKQIKDVEVVAIDLNEYEVPIYSIDKEVETGIPAKIQSLNELFMQADGFVVSLAEHNGTYTVAFKNIMDWLSREDAKVWKEKPVLLMATSPGPRGGLTVLEAAKDRFPRLGANLAATYTLPSFGDNFKENEGIIDSALKISYHQALQDFTKAL